MEPIQRISEANTNHKRNVSLLRVCFTNDLLYIEVKSPPSLVHALSVNMTDYKLFNTISMSDHVSFNRTDATVEAGPAYTYSANVC